MGLKIGFGKEVLQNFLYWDLVRGSFLLGFEKEEIFQKKCFKNEVWKRGGLPEKQGCTNVIC